ncbi:ATPase family associated with various cellular activities (AAA) [Chitinophaga eiseniae]|uniref:ATPase family associated with various cellular activities (AAA) n=1 Tax=Chitinophaga eiseniae TaxID=634771 RepID=A0A1T4SQA6_9BACT|nr:ATP-binding protein [Chitinophaga eiseniae]SKA30454.1 ATPase family associated with various cellular activities (AAA) [Chitinophaga eiseniae]
MNQDLLVRLFRSIEGEATDDIVRVAEKIIVDEESKGHIKLAGKLKSILNQNIQSYGSFKKELNTILPSNVTIPTDNRFKIPLAEVIQRDCLRHEMVLSQDIEHKILRIEKEYVARERLAKYGLKPKQKILLYGAPGCGKSMAAERIAWNVGLPFLKVRFEAVISSYLGESASNLKKLFQSLEHYPCVLLLDEFDFIAKARGEGNDVGEMHRLVNMLLGLLEDYQSEGILIATTNLNGIIDNALFRRFDEIIEMPKPEPVEVQRLLKSSLAAFTLSKDVKLNSTSEKMTGFSAAAIVKIARDAAKSCVIEGKQIIEQRHLDSALKENAFFNK